MDTRNFDPDRILSVIERARADHPLPFLPPASYEQDERETVDALAYLHFLEDRAVRDVKSALAIANERIEPAFSEPREVAASVEQRNRARMLLSGLYVDTLVDTAYGLDYALELRRRERLASRERNPLIFFALISIAARNDGIDRENHGYGYHFHHVNTRRGVVRTNVLLTFDPREQAGPPDTLYWEFHGGYARANPASWAPRRCVAIHSAARPSIHNPGKPHFMRPGSGATVLCRR